MHDVTAVVQREVGVGEPGRALHPLGFGALHMYRDRATVEGEELPQSLDRVPHDVAATVIGVVVRRQDAGEAEAVGREDVEERAHVIRGIDGDGLALLPVTDEVHEVDHLAGQGIALREVAP